MQRLLLVTFLLIFVISASGVLLSQVAKDNKDEESKKSEKKLQTQPAKRYDLSPKFTKDMTWKEDIELKVIQKSSYADRTEIYLLSGKGKVGELKDTKPAKIKYSKFGGKHKRERLYHRDGDVSSNENDIEKKNVTLDIDDKYKLKFDPKNSELDADFFLFYPAGNFMGFEVPVKPMAVGDTWSSKSLTPINFYLMGSEASELEFVNLKSEFKLVRIKEIKKTKIASILWTGSCTFQEEGGGDDSGTFKWKRTIEFDLTNRKLYSTNGTITFTMAFDDDLSMSVSLKRNFKYEKSEDKEEEDVKPKDDE